MIDISMAVDRVRSYLDSIDRLVPSSGARLEEFEYDPDTQVWNLTFSFDDDFGAQRLYRQFKVDDDGRVLSMKIRQLAD